ncbi:ABC transporter substrate-binding protein [Acuticoccus sediminis]|uniref:ABC transporter substrate-binding protein n=1 Tax=Acuticoccus sediminis TaxID=2184697 RepID=UPI001CFD98D1|nr:ABC transporter substrate-binding protein [Acuticoccus sediminis]
MANRTLRLLTATATALPLLLAQAATEASAQELVIATFGGSFLDASKECHIAPFEEATGSEVDTVVGNTTQHSASIRAMGGQSEYDVVYLDDSAATQLKNEGLLADIDRSQLTAAGQIDPRAFDESGQYVVFMTGATAIAYNTDLVDTPPTSWNDLFDEKWSGQIAIGDVTGTSGWQFLLAVNKLHGGTLEDITPGLEAIKPLAQDAVTLYTQADQLIALFERGEIAMAPWYPDRAGSAADQGLPIAIAYPKEGAVGIRPTLVIPKGAPHPELALKYIDTVLSKDGQECFAEKKYAGPVNLDVELSDKAAAIVPYGETLQQLWFLDPAVTSKELPTWIDRWQREVLR